MAASRDTASESSESSETVELADVVDIPSDADAAAEVSSSAQDQVAVEPVEPSEPEVSYLYPWVVDVRSEGDRTYVYDYNEAGRLVSITGQQGWNAKIFSTQGQSDSVNPDDYAYLVALK